VHPDGLQLPHRRRGGVPRWTLPAGSVGARKTPRDVRPEGRTRSGRFSPLVRLWCGSMSTRRCLYATSKRPRRIRLEQVRQPPCLLPGQPDGLCYSGSAIESTLPRRPAKNARRARTTRTPLTAATVSRKAIETVCMGAPAKKGNDNGPHHLQQAGTGPASGPTMVCPQARWRSIHKSAIHHLAHQFVSRTLRIPQG